MAETRADGLVAIAWFTFRPNRRPRVELTGAYTPDHCGYRRAAWSPRPRRMRRSRRRRLPRPGSVLSLGQVRRIERILAELEHRNVFEPFCQLGAWWEWDYDKYLDIEFLVITVFPTPDPSTGWRNPYEPTEEELEKLRESAPF
jgi:hypothetical protein